MACGAINRKVAIIITIVLLFIVSISSLQIYSIHAITCLILYFIINLGYSMGLKNVPILDVVILASGFVIRIFFGGYITGIEISQWLYLVVITGSLYMGLGKRRNELQREHNTRIVLTKYSMSFLDKNMYVFVALANAFYALWTIELSNYRMTWTVPLFIVLLMRYSFDTESDTDADPVEVLTKDEFLIGLIAAYVIAVYLIIY